jgi:hypothetical protein
MENEGYENDLAQARAGKNTGGGVSSAISTAKNMSKIATPTGVFSLLKQANLLKDMPFICAAGFALLKDILDLVFNETVILGILFSILCSIFIFLMLLLAGSNGKRKAASGLIKGVVLVGGGVVDSLPGLGFAPVETMTVAIIYMLVLADRANAKK